MDMKDRWDLAQQHEYKYWDRWKREVGLDRDPGEARQYLLRENFFKFMAVPHGHGLEYFRDKTVADVGCGPNPTIALEGAAYAKAFCVDPLIDKYQEILSYGEFAFENVKAGAEELPFENGSIDIILCLNAIDHMAEPSLALVEFARVLSRDGELYLTVYLNEEDEECHPHSMDLKDLLNMVSYAGLQVWHSEIKGTVGNLFTPLEAKLVCRKYSKFALLRERKIYIYGAGGAGLKLLKELKKFIPDRCMAGFIDSDPNKWNTMKAGKKIFSLKELVEAGKPEEALILIASLAHKEIAASLRGAGFREGIDFLEGFSIL